MLAFGNSAGPHPVSARSKFPGGRTLPRNRSEIRGKIFHGIAKNFDDRLSILKREPLVALIALLPREDLPQALEDGVASGTRQVLEQVGVDEITATISEEPLFQVELAQRSALPIVRSPRRKSLRERRGPRDGARQRRLVDE